MNKGGAVSEHIFSTCMYTFRLSDEFVREADARWPDKRRTRNPKWAEMVGGAIGRMGDALCADGRPVRAIAQLADVEPYL